MSEKPDQTANLSPLKQALLALDEMQSRLNAAERAKSEPIAIIGLGCRFPGGANDSESYWQLLRDEVDAIREVPADRWNLDDYYDPDPNAPGKMYSRHGGYLDEVDTFDAQFFGISPREAIALDPQQRLLLEVTWEALENAGLAPHKLEGSETGVFVGVMENDYAKLYLQAEGSENLDAYYVTGNHFSFTAGRLSYVLGLHGPVLALDTACSSSLAAIHLACQSLRSGESNMALAGGVNLVLSPELTISMCKFKALSPDGRCKTFDSAADGFGQGEGCGMVVLKRLSDAVADGDNILALIRGSAINHDGPSGGLTVPSGGAQQAVIRKALANARVQPDQVSYIEAHGTGTSLGDPIEVRALGAVYGEGRSEDERLIVGSVKTNIGHLDSAAGVAGLIKVVLSLQHKEIPAHLHLNQLNPHISLADIPVAIPTERVSWSDEKGPRTAGISSFGLSGTNVHMVLEEAPETQAKQREVERPLHLLTLSAKSEGAVKELAARFERRLTARPAPSLPDVCFTANTGRSHFDHRLALMAESSTQMKEQLAAFVSGHEQVGILSGISQDTEQPKIAFLFTGQGAQYVGMGRQLYETQPTFRKTLDRCDELLRPYLEQPLLSVIFSESDADPLLNETMYTQPALFSLEYALAQLWRSWGIEPAVVMGHSVGEYAAACFAGVYSLEDGLKLIAERGRLMQSLPKDGSMAVVFANQERVKAAIAPYTESVSIAAVNGPQSIVVSGERDAVQAVLDDLEADKVRVQPLNVSHAFHSPLMDPILDAFEQTARQVTFNAPEIPLLSNLTGRMLGDGDIPDATYWRRHIRQAVQFSAGIQTLYEQGYTMFLEVGPNPTLLGMGKRCIPDAEFAGVWLPSLRKKVDDWQQMLDSLANLYVDGQEVDWAGFDRDYAGGLGRVTLPTYPFQRQRHWIGDAEGGGRRAMTRSRQASAGALHPLLGQRVPSPLKDIQFETHLSSDWPPFMVDHQVYGTVVAPGTAYIEMALAAAEAVFGPGQHRLEEITIREALILPEDAHEMRTVQLILTPESAGEASFQVVSLTEEDDWKVHVTGTVRPAAADGAPVLDEFSLSAAQTRCQEELDASEHYAALRDAGLEYGPIFRGITRLWRHDGEVLGQVQVPETLLADNDNYLAHPALLDAALQLVLATSPEAQGAEEDAAVYLPVGMERIGVYQRLSGQLWGHVLGRSDESENQGNLVVDVRLFDEGGRIVAEVEALHVKRVSREALQRIIQPKLDNWLYEVSWQTQEMAPALESSAQRQEEVGSWLIFDDQGGVGTALASRLQAQGESCTLVVPGESYEAAGTKAWRVDPSRPADFDRLLNQVVETAQPLRGAVYLWGLANEPGTETDQELSCGGALYLLQALEKAEGVQRPGLWLVTRGAQSVGPDPMAPAVAQAPLWGLGSVITSEHPELHCVRVDLDPQPGMDDSEALFKELRSDTEETLVAFRSRDRYTARLVRSHFADNGGIVRHQNGQTAQPSGDIVRTNATYLITGGLGGLGLEVARWLVTQGALHLALLGRSGATGDAAEAVRELEDAGVQVMVARADVSDPGQMAKLLAEIDESMPPLHGVIHAAAVLDDGILLRQTWDRFDKVFAPKVAGAWNLHTLTQHMPLDFFVLFSSWSVLVGLPGQGNYVAANAFLDALAHHRRAQGLPALSINWGAWATVGMAAALDSRDQRRLADMGISAFIPELGIAAMERLLHQSPPQVAVFLMDWAKYFNYFPTALQLPFFTQLAAEAEIQAGAEKTLDTTKQAILAADPAERRQLIETTLREMAARVLRLPVTSIDVHQPLGDLGLDSLMATEFFAQIEKTFDKNLPLATLIEAPSIEQITDLLYQEDRAVSWSSLVEIQPGDSKPPVFFIHAEEGNILFYRDIARHLGEDQPFYGLQAQGLSGEEQIVVRPIEEMAAHYIEEIQTLQPHGPYYLGGFCMGAGLALEMAQQLQAQDEEVALLMMIQPLHLDYRQYPPRTTVLHRLVYRVMERVDYEVSKLSHLNTSAKLAYLRQRTERTATILEAKISMALEPLLDKTRWRIPHTKSYSLEALSESHKEAYLSYKPGPYRGRVIIFRASKQPLGIYPDPTLGWGRLIDGETETFEIPAYHQTILEEPQAQIVAEKLKPCLVNVNDRSASA